MSVYEDMKHIFEAANMRLTQADRSLFNMKVSERTLCGALALHLHEVLKETKYSSYYVDVEYNRNKGGKLKTYKKTAIGPEEKIVSIVCDLIMHSRGENILQDNLLAIEMKKSTRPKKEKARDKERLEALTKETYDDIWSYDGKSFPEHVCRYALGVYYEINFGKNEISIEYYNSGSKIEESTLMYSQT